MDLPDPVHQTDIELAFLVAVGVQIFGLRLQRVMFAEHAEEPALAGKAHMAVLIRADVHPEQLEARIFLLTRREARAWRRAPEEAD